MAAAVGTRGTRGVPWPSVRFVRLGIVDGMYRRGFFKLGCCLLGGIVVLEMLALVLVETLTGEQLWVKLKSPALSFEGSQPGPAWNIEAGPLLANHCRNLVN